jgi:hypothetical protein
MSDFETQESHSETSSLVVPERHLLEPFDIDFDAQWLMQANPELATMMLVEEPFFAASRDDLEEAYRENGASRSRIRRVKKTATRIPILVVQSLVRLIEDIDEPEDRLTAMEETEKHWVDDHIIKPPAGFNLKAVMRAMNEGAEYIHPFVVSVKGNKDSLQQRQLAETEGNPDKEYDLIKLVIKVEDLERKDKASGGEPDDDHMALFWFNMLLHAPDGTPRQSSTISESIMTKLKLGVYDPLIARDLLHATKSAPAEAVPAALRGLQDLVDLIEQTVGKSVDDEDLERLASLTHSWPAESQRVFNTHKAGLIKEFNTVSDYVIDHIGPFSRPPQDIHSRQQEVHSHLGMYLESVGGKKYRRQPKIERAHDIGSTALRLKRRHLAGDGKADTEESNNDINAEQREHPPLKLSYIAESGHVFDNDSPQFEDMIERYVSRYKSVNHLEDDVRRMLAYLSHLNFSERDTPGVKKMVQGSLPLLNGTQMRSRVTCLSFKPSLAKNLGLRSAEAKRCRIYFAHLDSDQLAIAEIGHRGDMQSFVRRRLVR